MAARGGHGCPTGAKPVGREMGAVQCQPRVSVASSNLHRKSGARARAYAGTGRARSPPGFGYQRAASPRSAEQAWCAVSQGPKRPCKAKRLQMASPVTCTSPWGGAAFHMGARQHRNSHWQPGLSARGLLDLVGCRSLTSAFPSAAYKRGCAPLTATLPSLRGMAQLSAQPNRQWWWSVQTAAFPLVFPSDMPGDWSLVRLTGADDLADPARSSATLPEVDSDTSTDEKTSHTRQPSIAAAAVMPNNAQSHRAHASRRLW